MYAVTKTHNFDPETEASVFYGYDEARKYLRWLWGVYYNEELENGSDMNRDECFFEDEYAKVQWADGDFTEFHLIEVTPARNKTSF